MALSNGSISIDAWRALVNEWHGGVDAQRQSP
jgi:hypothetical protein